MLSMPPYPENERVLTADVPRLRTSKRGRYGSNPTQRRMAHERHTRKSHDLDKATFDLDHACLCRTLQCGLVRLSQIKEEVFIPQDPRHLEAHQAAIFESYKRRQAIMWLKVWRNKHPRRGIFACLQHDVLVLSQRDETHHQP